MTSADLEHPNWNQNAVLYLSPGALVMSQEAAAAGGGGLSGGAIAGAVRQTLGLCQAGRQAGRGMAAYPVVGCRGRTSQW